MGLLHTEYKIDAPADVVVTEWGNKQYLKVFNFLWRIKRVEFSLSQLWGRCMTGARGVLRFVDEPGAESNPELKAAWKTARGGKIGRAHV